jgi:hypothetical protein
MNRDWGNRAPVLRFIPEQDRLNLIGLSRAEVGQQLQFLLTGVAVTQVREDIRNVPIVARSAGGERLDRTRLADFSLMSRDGRQIPLDQIGHSEVRLEEPVLKRRDRTPVITIRSDINEATQPPEVSKQVITALQPLIASLPAGYRIEMGGSIEEAGKANAALGKVFPAMIAATLIVAAARHWRCGLARRAGRMVAPVRAAWSGAALILTTTQIFGLQPRRRCFCRRARLSRLKRRWIVLERLMPRQMRATGDGMPLRPKSPDFGRLLDGPVPPFRRRRGALHGRRSDAMKLVDRAMKLHDHSAKADKDQTAGANSGAGENEGVAEAEFIDRDAEGHGGCADHDGDAADDEQQN